MSTLTSVAAVAAAETLASMTKASQLFSIADTSVTSNLNKSSILDEVPRPTGKDTKEIETSFQAKDSSNLSNNSKMSPMLASIKKNVLNDDSKSHEIHPNSDVEEIASGRNLVSTDENGAPLTTSDETKEKITSEQEDLNTTSNKIGHDEDVVSKTTIVSTNNNNSLPSSKHLINASGLHPSSSVSSPLTMEEAKQLMLSQYIPWVNSTYGDTAKTKTITKKKYSRIIALLRFNAEQKDTKSSTNNNNGSSINSINDATSPHLATLGGGNGGSELAKFKLWVKSKGFHLGPPEGHPDFGNQETENTLYLPTGTDKGMDGKVLYVYKKVAMVEQFFDIIYSVHVEAAGENQLRGRAGKHCGQKRTYRAVADLYAFIPREAISKFLLYCVDCQRKNALDPNSCPGSRNSAASSVANNNGRHKASKNISASNATNISTANKNISQSNNISQQQSKKPYPPNLSVISNSPPVPSFNNTLTNLLSGSSQLINGNNQMEMSNNAGISPIGSIGNLPGINPPSAPQSIPASTNTTAAQAAALSQAVAAMQTLAAGGVQHPLRPFQSPLIQARLAAGAASFVANNQLNGTNSLLQISRAQAAAAAAAAKAAFVAVQQQHLTNGGIGPAYNPDISLFREANSLLAATGGLDNMDSASTAMAGNDSSCNEHNTDPNLLSVSNLTSPNSEGNQPITAMNLTTNPKNSQSESLAQSQSKESIDLTLPITSTYIKRMKALGLSTGYEHLYDQQTSTGFNESPTVDRPDTEDSNDTKMDTNEAGTPLSGGATVVTSDPSVTWSAFGNGQLKQTKNGNGSQLGALLASGGQNNQNNSAPSPSLSDNTIDTSGHDDASSSGAKDDDDDDDDDDVNDDKIDGQICGDPEKLKAFNMFVRLFVDENLDRHVPISKQPKEKIQAIIDSCTRQFPEHSTRARKRIRTYLKSCRRTKRTREQAGLDGSNARPAPPHLTSVQAEQLLARACENESENAKRMRMGLEPISQPMPVIATTLPAISSEALSSAISTMPTYSLLQGTTGATVNPVATAPSTFGTIAINNLSNELLAAQQIALATQPGGPPLKQLKTEYKPEQLASLLQAAASQPLTMASITPATVGQPQQHQLLLTQSPLPPLQTQPPLSIVASGTNAAAAAAAILSPGNGALQLQPGNALPILPGLNGSLSTSIPTTTVVSPSTTMAATANLYRQTLQQQQTQLQQNSASFPNLQNPAPAIQNGCSTPDSMTGSTLGTAKKPALLNHKLNNTEITAVRQLVTGYRESAAFLLRSADELEHLLQIQPKL